MTSSMSPNVSFHNATANPIPVPGPEVVPSTSVDGILWLVFSPLLFVAGVPGNILNVGILVKLKFQNNTTLTLLLFLAITDMLVLVLGLSRYFLLYAADFDLRTLSSFGCSLSLFLIYLSMQLSSWLLVQITAIRFMKTVFPLRTKNSHSFTKRRPSLVIFFIILLLLTCVNAHFFWTNGINEDGDCGSLTSDFLYFDEYVFVYIDLLLLSVIPAVIIIILNALILNKIKRIRGNVNARISSVTKTLVALSIYFIAANVPICVYFIVDSYVRPRADPETEVSLDIAWSVTYLLQFSHFASNFYFYTGTNTKFRAALRILLKKTRKRLSCQARCSAERSELSSSEEIQLSHSTLSSRKKSEASLSQSLPS